MRNDKEQSMRSFRIFGISLLAAVGMLALLAGPSQARTRDRNHDRIPDKWERHYHLSLRVNQARRDQDHDGLTNLAEFRAQDNPRDADSDNNGIADGQENAGKITDITGNTVTVTLFTGGTITAQVTPDTEIECETSDNSSGDAQKSSFRDDGGNDQGDNQDNGDQGDQGDNNGCPPGALQVGAIVKEAEVELSNGTAVFHSLKLVG
jgi:hypothetical protein